MRHFQGVIDIKREKRAVIDPFLFIIFEKGIDKVRRV